jgi:hypothetical protein
MHENCILEMGSVFLISGAFERRAGLQLRGLIIIATAFAGFPMVPAQAGPVIPKKMCQDWASSAFIRSEGSVTEGGLTGKLGRLADPATGRFVEHRTYEPFSTGTGYDGRLSWSQDVSGAAHSLNAEFARRLTVTDRWIATRGWCRSGHGGARIRMLSTTRERGTVLDRWRATPRNGAPVELLFDRSSGLLRRFVEQLTESRLVETYSDWRRLANGAWLPFRERLDYPEDESQVTTRLDRASLVRREPKGAFERPGIPADHAILSASRTTSVPYEDDGRTRVYVPVTIDGHGPFTFELDSGGHLILTAETAEALGLRPKGELSSTGAAAVMKAGYVKLGELRIGDAVIRNQPAKVLPLPPWTSDRGTRPPRAGIIGLELFERFVVSIDPKAKVVTLSDPEVAASHRGVPLAIRFAEDAPLVDGGYGGHAGDFMIDTGNAGPTIIEYEWAAPRGLTARLKNGLRVDDDFYRCEAVRVGPVKLDREVIDYVGPTKSGSESTHAVAGIYGAPLLSRFDSTYDYSRGTAWLRPLADVGLKPFNRSGLLLSKEPGRSLKVDGTIEGSPAAAAGVKAGDVIIALDGKDTAAMSRAETGQILARPAGQIVQLDVQGKTGGPRHIELRLWNVLPCK